jgi:hypothetical protein
MALAPAVLNITLLGTTTVLGGGILDGLLQGLNLLHCEGRGGNNFLVGSMAQRSLHL